MAQAINILPFEHGRMLKATRLGVTGAVEAKDEKFKKEIFFTYSQDSIGFARFLLIY